jgi:hypothetical protein
MRSQGEQAHEGSVTFANLGKYSSRRQELTHFLHKRRLQYPQCTVLEEERSVDLHSMQRRRAGASCCCFDMAPSIRSRSALFSTMSSAKTSCSLLSSQKATHFFGYRDGVVSMDRFHNGSDSPFSTGCAVALPLAQVGRLFRCLCETSTNVAEYIPSATAC